MAGNKPDVRGFSLLETMIATVVLAVGLLALVGLFETGMKALGAGEKKSTASRMAKNKMDALRSDKRGLPVTGADPEEEGIVIRWEVRPGEKDPAVSLIAVESRWKGTQGRDHVLLLKSFFYAD